MWGGAQAAETQGKPREPIPECHYTRMDERYGREFGFGPRRGRKPDVRQVTDMNPVTFNITHVSRALLRTGGGQPAPVLSDRNHLSHTPSPQQLGGDCKPISETHTAFVFCLLFGSPWRRVPASPVALQAGASQKVLEPHRVWIHSLHSRPVVPQVPYWSGEFLRGCWQGGSSK